MDNPWVEFLKQYSKDNSISYGCAISEAGPAYRAMKQGAQTPKAPTKKRITVKPKINNTMNIIEEPNTQSFEEVLGKLERELMSSGFEKVIKALDKLNYKYKGNKNILDRNAKILKDFNTIPKMEALLEKLKKIKNS
jgi:hypothetical protein